VPNPNPQPVTSTSVLDDAKALVAEITILVGPPAALTKADVQKSVKLRKGGASVVQTIATLSDQFGLVVPSSPTATMVDEITRAQALVPLHKQLEDATKQVADAIFELQSKSWAAAMLHYSMLRRLAKADGGVAIALEPVKQFFAARSAAVTAAEKAKRGGARKGSKKAKAYRASQRAAPAASDAATTPAAQTGASPSPQATPTPANGASHQ
jgi:hypothetical protein